MLGLRQHRGRLCLAQARRGGMHRRLEHARIDHEQLAALLDKAPFRHAHILQIAGHLRAQLDPLDGGQRTVELDVRCCLANDHFRHWNAGRLGGSGRRYRLLASADGERGAQHRGDQGYWCDFHHCAFRDWSRHGFVELKQLPWPLSDLTHLEGQAFLSM
ncbi:hypothetical protein D3C81_712370 [compost metagenome]